MTKEYFINLDRVGNKVRLEYYLITNSDRRHPEYESDSIGVYSIKEAKQILEKIANTIKSIVERKLYEVDGSWYKCPKCLDTGTKKLTKINMITGKMFFVEEPCDCEIGRKA